VLTAGGAWPEMETGTRDFPDAGYLNGNGGKI
jgi:hypothetical protein